MPVNTRIAILSMNFPPEPTGIGPYSGALATGLSLSGCAVTAHVAQPHYPGWTIDPRYKQWSRREIFGRVRVVRRLHYVPKPPRGLRRLASELSFGIRLVFGRWFRPDVIVAVSPSLFSTALVILRTGLTPRRPKTVIWVQDLYSLGLKETGESTGVIWTITRWLESWTLRSADRVVVIHQMFADYVVQTLGVHSDRVDVIRNWTHLSNRTPVDRIAAKRSLGWPEDVLLSVHTGNMGTKQGLENVVEAARLAEHEGQPVHFILLGDGAERSRLEQIGAGVSTLTLIGPLSDPDYLLALSAADILLVNEKPGVSSMAVPSKLTSYFDAGKAIIAATDPSGTTAAELRASGAGMIVKAGDPSGLLDAVMTIGSDEEKMAEFGANGRAYRLSALDQTIAIARWTSLIADI